MAPGASATTASPVRSRSRSAPRAPARRPCAWPSRCARPATTSSWRRASCTRRACWARRLELAEIKYCTDVELGEQAYNVVTVHLRRPFEAELVQRNFGVTSACGVCGKASIDSIEVASEPLAEGAARRGVRDRRAARSACAPRSARSSAPAGCTPPGCSRPTASSRSCARTSGGTTRSTRSSATACWRAPTPLGSSRRAGLGPRLVRARAEGGGGRHPGAVRRRRAVQPGRGRRAPPRADARGLRARRPLQRVRRELRGSPSRSS